MDSNLRQSAAHSAWALNGSEDEKADKVPLPRQLLVFCDGTNNTLNGGPGDTNVLKLAQGLREGNPADTRQVVWYDPGVGAAVNLPEAALLNQFKGYLRRLWGLAFGDGVYENIAQAIGFLAHNYQMGDQIFLFGFSRGAFTARAVGGVINQYGLPAADQLHLLPLLIQRYFSAANHGSERDRDVVAQARMMSGARRVFVHFVGVWDTVDAVGWPIPLLSRRIRNTGSLSDKCFVHVRHVVALDEHRRQFRPRLYQCSSTGEHRAKVGTVELAGTHKQVALPGCHSDIGGGYEESGLSDVSLSWMVNEAQAQGLRIGSYKVSTVGSSSPVMMHSELRDSFLWALLGQSVRSFSGGLTPLQPQGSTHIANASPASVWQTGSAWRLWVWVLSIALCAFFLVKLSAVPEAGIIPRWQLLTGFGWASVSPPEASSILRHLMLDLGLVAGLALGLGLANSAGFAKLASFRKSEQGVAVWLNAWGLALPAYIGADLAENACTAMYVWLMPNAGPSMSLAALLMSVSAVVKFLAFAAATVLGMVGIWTEASAWLRMRRWIRPAASESR